MPDRSGDQARRRRLARARRSALGAGAVLLACASAWQILSTVGGGPEGPPPLPAPVLTAPAPAGPLPSVPPGTARAPGPGSAAQPTPRTPGLERSIPIKIVIRSINLRAGIREIGLDPGGRIETPPYDKAHHAAWYRLGPSPGEPGPTVIIGHVDSEDKVAVFFYLSRIRPGDLVEVTRTDRRTVVYTVKSVEQIPKADFPTARVYGPTAAPVLRLVTCGGRFDRARYTWTDNIVVFARQTGVRESPSP